MRDSTPLQRKLMRWGFQGKLFWFLALVLVGVSLVMSLTVVRTVFETNIESLKQEKMLQVKRAARDIELSYQQLLTLFLSFVSIDAFKVFTPDDVLIDARIEIIRRFYSLNQDILSQLRIQSADGRFVTVKRSLDNYFSIDQGRVPTLQAVSIPKKIEVKGDEYILSESVYGKDGELSYTVSAVIDLTKLVESNLRGIFWGIDNSILLMEPNESVRPLKVGSAVIFKKRFSSLDLFPIQKDIVNGFADETEHVSPSGGMTLISFYAPITLSDSRFGLIFSFKSKQFYSQLHAVALALGVSFILLLSFCVMVLMKVLLQSRAIARDAVTNRNLLYSVINSSEDLVFLKDASLRYQIVNHGFESWFGIPQEKFIGRTLQEVLPGFAPDFINMKDQMALSEGGWTGEQQIDDRWIHVTLHVVRDWQGTITGLAGTISDITERKQKSIQLEHEIQARMTAEASLIEANEELENRVRERTNALKEQSKALMREVAERAEAEETLRLVFNSTHDSLLIHDGEGNIRDVNDRMLELYQVERSMVGSLSIVDDLSGPGNPVDSLSDKWHRALKGEQVVFEWLARRPGDGSTFHVQVACNRVELGGQAVILATVTDISDHKDMLAQQREHQEFLNTVFEGIGAAIFVYDPGEKKMVDCNAVGETMLSLSKEAILAPESRGQYFFSSETRTDLLLPEMEEVGSYAEGVLSFPDQFALPVLVSRRMFDVQIGGRSHLVQVVLDITERKNLERKLSIAQKLESIGRLSAGIAHEINTPIQYIGNSIGFIERSLEDVFELIEMYEKVLAAVDKTPAVIQLKHEIEEAKDDLDLEYVLDEVPKSCERAQHGVEQVATIVRAMKNFSHPGEEKPVPIDINKAIENTVIVSRNEWKYSAELETFFAPDLPLVKCLPGSINQVFLNIIVNAAHAISEAGHGEEKGTITIQTRYEYPFVEIRISDTGCGIPHENLAKIFDPFFTTKEVGKGTGQGLAIAYGIVVDKVGGTIDVQSKPDEGTTFIIRLPADDGKA